ncbi:MAG TPA: NADH-quinone oxidoreductase subunit J [Methylomirabilota bacterium]|nr:NADH-quinone oxidoreductase subunit J [Methylomirabilota bacterium]
MTLSFAILALLVVVASAAAMSLRNLIHCALALVVLFIGLAALYMQLHAQFIGLAQILVYVGAVAVLIVFAILLTRGDDPTRAAPPAALPVWGVVIALAVFGVIAGAVRSSSITSRPPPASPPRAAVKQIGDRLMTDYVLPLEVIGLLLTAAMIGAVIIALREKEAAKPETPTERP